MKIDLSKNKKFSYFNMKIKIYFKNFHFLEIRNFKYSYN